MELARERFLDDSRTYHFTLSLRSRTTEAHSLLSGLTADEREQVGVALVTALDRIDEILRSQLSR